MKKIALTLVMVILLGMLMSCGIVSGITGQPDNSGSGSVTDETPDNNTNDNTNDTENTPDDGKEDGGEVTPPEDEKGELPSDMIYIRSCKGLNEQIYVNIMTDDGFVYRVYYKEAGESEYSLLDENLMILSGDKLECYIVGIKQGTYQVKIEAERDNKVATKIVDDVAVAEQDRSGYAHFGSSEGVGAYNNDGTLKEGTKVVYVTNENKNTVTLTIDGTEYVGLVNILQAQYKSNTPMLIRVIGKITTNQWNYKNVAPRLSDGSNYDKTFFDNTFSTEYGENLANLIVKMKFQGGIDGMGQTYNYRTTADGLTDVRITNGGTKYVYYNGSDFAALKGKQVFDDDSYYNMLEVKGSSNITIEGIGPDAEFFQFGVSFEECTSIEVKNIAFTDYPEDALNFLGSDRASIANNSRYWVHSCTFNRGYNAWDISGERDKYAGDGSVDFNNVSNVTISYNKYNSTKKSMLFGSGDSEACMNFTMHHNYFYKVDSRLPLGRNVNIHSYNNYFDQCKNVSDIRKNSYIFSENNYFNSTAKPFILNSSMAKSYGDIFVNSSQLNVTIVTDRTQVVSISCKPDNKTDYSSFDLNSELFYYDSVNHKTDVTILHDASYSPSYVTNCAGAGYYGIIEVSAN